MAKKTFLLFFMVPGTRSGSTVSQNPMLVTSPVSLRLGPALGGKEAKQTLGANQRQLQEQTGQSRSPHPGDPPVRFQLFSSQCSQDPRFPAKPTGNPASLGVSQESEEQDTLPF